MAVYAGSSCQVLLDWARTCVELQAWFAVESCDKRDWGAGSVLLAQAALLPVAKGAMIVSGSWIHAGCIALLTAELLVAA